ncbi:hypothetical protein GGR52DRAFT_578273 [Hypoxylon sp. FL1284]|nr:hypothetical protein GGR52DRAFT_578273 [Hypoxylon sp. FL1284]
MNGHSHESEDIKNHLDVTHIEHPPEDYTRNVNARIINPLIGILKENLLLQVRGFCVEYGFEDREELFFRGALAAQSPAEENYMNIPELTEDDKLALKREVTHKWHLPRHLYYAIALCSLGSAVQGWDNTGSNGANLSFPQEFGIADNEWLIGVINAAPTLFGLCSAWAADPINNWIGRRGSIFVTGLFCIFPVLAQAFTHSWQQLLICRLFMGLGMGIKISVIPIYTAEVSPASIRGGMVTSFQLWVAFGIMIGTAFNLAFYRIGALAWRFQLAAAFVPAIPVVLLVWWCPESPRWLMKKGRYREAFRSFCRLRNTEMQAARELYYVHRQVIEERSAFGGRTLGRRIWELLSVPRLRRATMASSWIVISQQFSGINIMAIYSSTVFSSAGYGTSSALLASFGCGLVMFVFAFPALYTMDTFGRRNLLLFTFPNMGGCLTSVSLCFLMSPDNPARVPLIAFFIYFFTALYGLGIGPMPFIYLSEAFPLSHREIGGAFTICVNNAIGSALSISFPALFVGVKGPPAFSLYAGLNLVSFIGIFLIVPETKQRTLEELDYIFSVPTRKHIKYQVHTFLPWWMKRYVLFRRDATLKPLYHLEGYSARDEAQEETV